MHILYKTELLLWNLPDCHSNLQTHIHNKCIPFNMYELFYIFTLILHRDACI